LKFYLPVESKITNQQHRVPTPEYQILAPCNKTTSIIFSKIIRRLRVKQSNQKVWQRHKFITISCQHNPSNSEFNLSSNKCKLENSLHFSLTKSECNLSFYQCKLENSLNCSPCKWEFPKLYPNTQIRAFSNYSQRFMIRLQLTTNKYY